MSVSDKDDDESIRDEFRPGSIPCFELVNPLPDCDKVVLPVVVLQLVV